VYAVFASLGFAAIENIGYVFGNGWGVALLRMFTAVPGHACFGVFMGFFYSKAKYASLSGNKADYSKYNALSMICPIVIHGIYDAIVMGGTASGYDLFIGLSLISWIVFVIVLFVISVIMIVHSSKNDFCIVTLPNAVQTFYRPMIIGPWNCECGTGNYLNFCASCGRQRPYFTSWYCPTCGTLSVFNFCSKCGCPKPMIQPQAPVQ